MKKCPYCAEEIQNAAKKCKHCGEFLSKDDAINETNKKVDKVEVEKQPISADFSGVVWGIFFIIILVVIFHSCSSSNQSTPSGSNDTSGQSQVIEKSAAEHFVEAEPSHSAEEFQVIFDSLHTHYPSMSSDYIGKLLWNVYERLIQGNPGIGSRYDFINGVNMFYRNDDGVLGGEKELLERCAMYATSTH